MELELGQNQLSKQIRVNGVEIFAQGSKRDQRDQFWRKKTVTGQGHQPRISLVYCRECTPKMQFDYSDHRELKIRWSYS